MWPRNRCIRRLIRVRDNWSHTSARGAGMSILRGRGCHRPLRTAVCEQFLEVGAEGCQTGMDAVDQQELATALTEVSKSFAAHGRWAKHLLDAFERSPKLFMTEFLPQIYRLLLIFKRCASVERVVQFVCRLAVEPTTNPRLNGKMAFVIVQKLLGFHSAKDKAVRFRVCQIIGVILSKMTDGTELSDELLDEIQSTMLLRIKDKVAAVRAMSCLCLARLQDPTNLDDDVVSAIIFAAEHDSSNIVRKSALANLGVSKATLPYILARIKDTCADVRLAALKVCSEKLAMKALSISQRTTLLYAAITDRDNEVKKACEELLIPTWLAQCDNSIFVFLSCLDVQEFEKESERIAAFCVSHQISKDMCSDWKLETDADLSPEKALVWRVYAEQLRKQKKFDIIESAFPVPVEFADTLRAHHTNTFVTSQLLKVFTVIEIDEVGRSVLTNLFLEWLRSSETDVLLIPSIMKALYRILVHRQSVVTGESEFTTNTLLVLADLRDPLEEIGPNDDQRKQQEAEMEQRYEDLKQQLEEAQALKTEYIRLEDFGGASEQKKLISEIEKEMQDIDDVLTAKETVEHAKWQRLIAVTSSLLQHVRRTPFSSLHDLCESTIHPAIIHESELIREPALRCLCLYSLLDAETARSNLTIFTKAIYNDVPSVQLTSIKSCFDLLMVHDLCQDADVRESVIGVLVEFLSSEDSELRTTAVKGFAKLLFNDRISNVNILCTLIILLFNPTTEDDVELRQTLSLFFPLYCEESHTHRSSLGEAILPACRIFINAPHQSPLRKVASSQVAPFVLFLVGNDPNDIGSLAFDLVAELLSNTSNPAHVRFLSHMLSLVPLDAVTGTQIKELTLLAKRATDEIEDKISLRQLTKCLSALSLKDSSPDMPLSQAEIASLDLRIAANRLPVPEPDASMESVPRPPTLSDIVIPSASSGDESHLSDDAPVKSVHRRRLQAPAKRFADLASPPPARAGPPARQPKEKITRRSRKAAASKTPESIARSSISRRRPRPSQTDSSPSAPPALSDDGNVQDAPILYSSPARVSVPEPSLEDAQADESNGNQKLDGRDHCAGAQKEGDRDVDSDDQKRDDRDDSADKQKHDDHGGVSALHAEPASVGVDAGEAGRHDSPAPSMSYPSEPVSPAVASLPDMGPLELGPRRKSKMTGIAALSSPRVTVPPKRQKSSNSSREPSSRKPSSNSGTPSVALKPVQRFPLRSSRRPTEDEGLKEKALPPPKPKAPKEKVLPPPKLKTAKDKGLPAAAAKARESSRGDPQSAAIARPVNASTRQASSRPTSSQTKRDVGVQRQAKKRQKVEDTGKGSQGMSAPKLLSRLHSSAAKEQVDPNIPSAKRATASKKPALSKKKALEESATSYDAILSTLLLSDDEEDVRGSAGRAQGGAQMIQDIDDALSL